MTKKIYRTAQGRIVDFGALEVQNEHVRAVGNMNVNARGDKLDSDGRVISTRAQQVNRNLSRTTNTAPGPIPTSSRTQKEDTAAIREAEQEKIEKARAQRQALREQGAAPPVEQPEAGLAAALARAAKITDEE
jgi:protein involved in temperature-dependent protein secretion